MKIIDVTKNILIRDQIANLLNRNKTGMKILNKI